MNDNIFNDLLVQQKILFTNMILDGFVFYCYFDDMKIYKHIIKDMYAVID